VDEIVSLRVMTLLSIDKLGSYNNETRWFYENAGIDSLIDFWSTDDSETMSD
jgi:hypothetical protein